MVYVIDQKLMFIPKMGQPDLFMFIFYLFKHKFYRITVGFSGIRTRIVGIEGEPADHLTTTTAKQQCVCF